MKKLNLSIYDLKYHFKRNKSFYIAFLIFSLLGIAVGIFIVLSSENYLNILSANNKVLYTYINGTANLIEIFGKKLISFIIPMLLIFLLGLNFYTSLLSYLMISYQFALMILTSASVISIYGISGILNTLLIIIPVNIIYFVVLIFFAVTCISRSKSALDTGRFGYGFDSDFILKVVLSIIMVILLATIVCVILPLFLKNANFIIF